MMTGSGKCCPSGDCICRGDPPAMLTSAKGPFQTATMRIAAGTVVYPTDAEPPFSALSICPGFLNSGPEMADWGPFYASYGIVTVITNTLGSDQPATRGQKLAAAIAQLKQENTKEGSPLKGKLSGRYGTSGYSMGGGGTTIASGMDATLKTSVGLAAFGGQGRGIKAATLLLCGSVDTTAPCSMSQSVYRSIDESVPKMLVTISGASHFSWFSPQDGERGRSGAIALAWQKTYLDGDERWKPLLQMARGNPTNVK